MRILGGAHPADEGEILIDGSATPFRSPQDSRAAGIAVIYQEFNLVPGLTAVENIFLGRETTRGGLVEQSRERERAAMIFRRLGAHVDLDTPCRRLTIAQQQLVEIAKALAFDAQIIVMDEPSAALTAQEVERLFEIIRDLKKQGISIIYISHRLDEIFEITDRVTVLRDGLNVGAHPTPAITRAKLIQLMVGREVTDEFPKRSTVPGSVRLEVCGLRRGRSVNDVSFTVKRGEILAFTGLVGAGRTEAMRLLFGADKREAGDIRLDGARLHIGSPIDAIGAGIGLLPEDRKTQGLVLDHAVRENFGLPNLDRFSNHGFVQMRTESHELARYVKQLRIKIADEEQRAGDLSGGNQQKVVLAKWLARNCEILIFDEPTRGVDVGAKFEIYVLMNEIVAAGKSIIMVSSELPEVLGMADRILVMHEGRITGEIEDVCAATQEQVMRLAIA